MNNIGNLYLESTLKRFAGTKELGERALAQLSDADLAWRPGPESNSIAVNLQHLHGNMLSRWTDFLTTDGEKPARDRDGEFTEPEAIDRETLMNNWEAGWACLFDALRALHSEDLTKSVTIRGQSLSALDAINRQLAHYSYHVGQIVYLGRMRKGEAWETLSIAKGASRQYKPAKQD